MEEKEIDDIHQIFDSIFKKVITLSAKAVVYLINGLFDTDYPPDSTVDYNWTEFHDDKLKKILADTIITINRRYAYHLEAQIEKDNAIVFRVFSYGFGHADRNRNVENGEYILNFPRPVVIYLYYVGEVPDEYVLKLRFEEGQDEYQYHVPVIKLPEITPEELTNRKMVILIPFHLLKLRKMVKKYSATIKREHKVPEGLLKELKHLIQNDIIGSIEANHELGNITTEDAYKLRRYTQQLWEYIQTHTEELKEVEEMTDESFMTDIDILCEEYNKKIEQAQKEAQEAKKEAQVQSEKAIKLALIKSIENVMKSFQCTLEEACKAVGSSLAEYNEAKQLQQ